MENCIVELHDPKAIQILEQFPQEERGKVTEKYIIVGDTVVRYAQIVTSEESLQRYFDPVTTDLGTLAKNLENTRKQLEGRIPDTLKANLNGVIAQLTAASDSLASLHQEYQGMLSTIMPVLSKPSTKAAVSCQAVFQSLEESFRDDRFDDVSTKARFTDILGTPLFSTQPIYVEVKDYSNPVKSDEVKKFWQDLETRKASIGCFVSLRTPIRTVTSDFCIVTQGSRIGIFVVSGEMNNQGHVFAYLAARKMLEMILQRGGAIETEKYEWVARVLNRRIQEFRASLRDMEQIETDIAQVRSDVNDKLAKIAKRTSDLRTKLETIIEVTLGDFSEGE
jgi:hypothetical protein